MTKPVPLIPISPGIVNPYCGMSLITGGLESKNDTEIFLNGLFADLRKHLPRSLRLTEDVIAPWSDPDLITHLSRPKETQVWVFSTHINSSVICLCLTAISLGVETFLICQCLEDQEPRHISRLRNSGVILMTRDDFRKESEYVLRATRHNG